jgi:hypothetical protein
MIFRGQHDAVLVCIILVGLAHAFWLIYKSICQLSGHVLREAEKLVVDVGVPAHVPAPQHATGPAALQAAAMDGAPVAFAAGKPGEQPPARADEASSTSASEAHPRRTASRMPARN